MSIMGRLRSRMAARAAQVEAPEPIAASREDRRLALAEALMPYSFAAMDGLASVTGDASRREAFHGSHTMIHVHMAGDPDYQAGLTRALGIPDNQGLFAHVGPQDPTRGSRSLVVFVEPGLDGGVEGVMGFLKGEEGPEGARWSPDGDFLQPLRAASPDDLTKRIQHLAAEHVTQAPRMPAPEPSGLSR